MQVFTFPIFHLTDMLIAEGQLSDWSEESVKCEAAAAWPQHWGWVRLLEQY